MTLRPDRPGGGLKPDVPHDRGRRIRQFRRDQPLVQLRLARPWRMLFYTLVAVVYRALSVSLRAAFHLPDAGPDAWVRGRRHVRPRSTDWLWPMMWRGPSGQAQLSYDPNWLTLRWDQDVAAFFIAFWVYLLISVLGAFAISFYFTANTIIYYLMRHEVDATEMDDVYLEQSDEDFGESAPLPRAARGVGDCPGTRCASPRITAEGRADASSRRFGFADRSHCFSAVAPAQPKQRAPLRIPSTIRGLLRRARGLVGRIVPTTSRSHPMRFGELRRICSSRGARQMRKTGRRIATRSCPATETFLWPPSAVTWRTARLENWPLESSPRRFMPHPVSMRVA